MLRLLVVMLLAPVFLSAQDQVIGDRPADYSPLRRGQSERDLRKIKKTKTLQSQDILQASARAHNLTALTRGVTPSSTREGVIVIPPNPPGTPPPPPPSNPPPPVTPGSGSDQVVGGFIYERIFNNKIRIAIKDEGFGLRDSDHARIRAYLDRLPLEHLSGLKEIAFGNDKRVPGVTLAMGNRLVINADRSDFDWVAGAYLSEAIGDFVYHEKLTDAERKEWGSLPMPVQNGTGHNNDRQSFRMKYAAYTTDSNNVLLWSVGDPERKTPRIASCAVLGGQSCTPVEVQPDPLRDLPATLFVSSLFVEPHGIVGLFRTDESNVVQRDYGRAARNDQVITLGNYNFFIENGKIHSWNTDVDLYKPLPANGIAFTQAPVFSAPIDIPKTVLSRINFPAKTRPNF